MNLLGYDDDDLEWEWSFLLLAVVVLVVQVVEKGSLLPSPPLPVESERIS